MDPLFRSQLKAQKARQVNNQDDKPQGAVKKQGAPVMSHAARMLQLAACTDVRQPRAISPEDVAAGCHLFPAEDDEGNTEYKLRLKEPACSPIRFQQLVSKRQAACDTHTQSRLSGSSLLLEKRAAIAIKLTSCTKVDCALQVTQMKFRLAEGNGECFYFIGKPLIRAREQCA